MRRAVSLVFALAMLALPLGGWMQLPQATPSRAAAEPSASGDLGPHLMLPDPDVFPRVPFSQPEGWTGTPPGTRGTGTRATGVQDVVVLLIQFSDRAATKTTADVQGLMAEARAYYLETSYNLLTIQSTVAPWVTSSRPLSNYGSDGSTSYDSLNGPIYRLVTEAVQLADAAGFNFASHDRDGDGVLDHLIVIHAADAQEASAVDGDIWSHRWSVVDANPGIPGDQRLTVDGVQIFGYILASQNSPLGVLVHELGHDFGLPDLYDTDGTSDGVGVWDIMGSGSWNGIPRGTVPAHFGAWAKVRLGWVAPVVVTSPLLGQVIDQMETTRPDGTVPRPFKLPIGTSGGAEEYFLVENRQRVGFDRALPASGLLIWHVDESVQGNANDAHRLVDLEEADDNDKPVQATDPWAGDPNGFGPETVPNSGSYLNQRTGWKVRNIGPSGTTMVADLSREVDDDLVVSAVRAPCCVALGGAASVSVDVENRGSRTQSDVVVNLTARVGEYDPARPPLWSQERTIASIAKGETATAAFSVPASTLGRHVLEASVERFGDEVPENNFRFARFHAASYALLDNIDPPDPGWTTNSGPGDPASWRIVLDGPQVTSRSPLRAWYFGPNAGDSTCAPSCPSPYNLTIGPISVTSGPVYLYFWHRYDLRGRAIENFTGSAETDTGYVNVSVNGVVRINRTFTEREAAWTAFFADLTPWVGGPSLVNLSLSATADVVQDTGGWWVDDVAIANAPLRRGLAARAVSPEVVVEPGFIAFFRFKVANVGDFDDTVRFELQPPDGWTAAVGHNESRLQAPAVFQADLLAEAEASLLLGMQVPIEEQRGYRHSVPVTVRSLGDGSETTTFETVTVIHDPFGLAGLERYVFFFLVVLAAIIVIAVVIDAIKKQRGVYRRW